MRFDAHRACKDESGLTALDVCSTIESAKDVAQASRRIYHPQTPDFVAYTKSTFSYTYHTTQ